jgi:CBS domain-containing protein
MNRAAMPTLAWLPPAAPGGRHRVIPPSREKSSPLFRGRNRLAPRPLLAERQRPTQSKENPMKVSDIMTRDVHLASPSQKLREVAAVMEKHDIGVLPVGDNDRLVGMITDRDIAVRGISHGLGPDAPVRDVMTNDVRYCFEDENIEDLAQNMADEQIRRLPVLNSKKRLVGIIALADLAVSQDGRSGEMALSGISQTGGQHCQSASA